MPDMIMVMMTVTITKSAQLKHKVFGVSEHSRIRVRRKIQNWKRLFSCLERGNPIGVAHELSIEKESSCSSFFSSLETFEKSTTACGQ